MEEDIFVQADEIAWQAEVAAIKEQAWREINRLRESGGPETARAIDILSYMIGLGAWSPGGEEYLRGHVKESDIPGFKESALTSLRKLRQLLGAGEGGTEG